MEHQDYTSLRTAGFDNSAICIVFGKQLVAYWYRSTEFLGFLRLMIFRPLCPCSRLFAMSTAYVYMLPYFNADALVCADSGFASADRTRESLGVR